MELWKDIADFENYEVSSFGNVRNKKTERILKCGLNGANYMFTNLSNKGRNKSIHRLVACAFIENPNNFPQVDHIDKNPLNNNVENLRWVTCQQNLWNRTTKNISITINNTFCVSYNIDYKKVHHKVFKTEQEAIDYLTEVKIKYPRII